VPRNNVKTKLCEAGASVGGSLEDPAQELTPTIAGQPTILRNAATRRSDRRPTDGIEAILLNLSMAIAQILREYLQVVQLRTAQKAALKV